MHIVFWWCNTFIIKYGSILIIKYGTLSMVVLNSSDRWEIVWLPENFVLLKTNLAIPYSGLISRGEIFKVFVDFALSSKFKPRKFYDLLYIAITEVGRRLWWSQMTRKAALNISGRCSYSKFSAKSRAKFTAEHTAIAAS